MIKAIIFDCFGVVVTFGFHAAFQAMGGNLDADKKFLKDLFDGYNSGKISDNQLLGQLSEHLGIDTTTIAQTLAKSEHLNYELLSYIEELRTSYKVGLLSNIGRGGIERYFKDINPMQYFDDMVLSGEVGFVKPQPEIYLLAAQKLNVELSECVFIDDAENNCTAAQEAGMKAIVYKDFGQFKSELEPLLHHT